MLINYSNWRSVCSAVALVGLFACCQDGTVRLSAAPTYDWCYNDCGPEASCGLECENDGGGITTCGEYNEGIENGWCSPLCSDVCSLSESCATECLNTGNLTTCEGYSGAECSNSCDVVCSSMESDGSESCTESGGAWTTCEDYGVYVHCPDGVCAPSETSACADCAPYHPSSPMPNGLKEELPQDPTFNEDDTKSACELAVSYNWAPGWDCPTWDWLSNLDPNHPSCAAKNAALADVNKAIAEMNAVYECFWAFYGCPNESADCQLALSYYWAVQTGHAIYNNINSMPCYLF